MANYNPNSIWESKDKEYEYKPKPSSFTGGKPFVRETPVKATKPSGPTPPSQPNSSNSNGPSFFKRHGLAFFSVGLVILLGIVALVVYLLLPPATPNVQISFSKSSDQILVGSPFVLSVTYSNESASALKNATLNLQLPSTISFMGQNGGQRVLSQPAGDATGEIGAESINKKDFNLIVTGNPSTVQHITATLTYATAATSQTQFESDGKVDINVGQPSIGLNFTAPSNIFSGQDFDITVNYINNTAEDIDAVQIKTQYPPAFVFKKSSNPAITSQNNTWNLGTLAAGATSSFTITGDIIGPTLAQYPITGTVSANFSGQSYTVDSETASLAVAPSPLSLSLALNGTSSYITKPGDSLDYTLTYTNNSNITFQNLSISASLLGAMFDLTSVHSDASFNSRNNTLTWFTANTPGLLSLAPGESGSVNFSVNTKSTFPIKLVSDKNYSVQVNAQIQSPTVLPNTSGNQTVSATTIQNKVGGMIAVTSKGYWRDASSGILNSGPYPPKVNQATQYTIHWSITNYATDMQNVTLSAYLQSGSTFTGKIKSNVSSTPTYNAATGLVTWTVPYVPATTGVVSPPIQAIFQISNIPAINQVNQVVTLMGPMTFMATDAFTSSSIQDSTAAITTELPDDPTLSGTGVVTQ